MLKINNLRWLLLRNDEHFQASTEFKNLVQKHDSQILKIKSLFEEYLECYAKEDEAMLVIRKSAISQDLIDADARRDNDFRGFIDSVKAAQRHFNPEVVKAANKLKIAFDTAGNVVLMPNDQETSKIYNLIQELNDQYKEDVKTLKMEDWVARLDESNKRFENLTRQRVEEVSQRTLLKVKETRKAVEEKYANIITCIEAHIVLGEEELYKDFVSQLNALLDGYKNLLAQRQGRAEAKKEKNKEEKK